MAACRCPVPAHRVMGSHVATEFTLVNVTGLLSMFLAPVSGQFDVSVNLCFLQILLLWRGAFFCLSALLQLMQGLFFIFLHFVLLFPTLQELVLFGGFLSGGCRVSLLCHSKCRMAADKLTRDLGLTW